ncbi:MAG: hypothetical protein EOP60_01980 [Sphingomonadales bacterium]|nr:MAG: hypothetical protein EOP60_01980 [Sphingomonadales bacterium]
MAKVKHPQWPDEHDIMDGKTSCGVTHLNHSFPAAIQVAFQREKEMDMRGNSARLAALIGSAMMCSVMPVIPAASAKPPNCAVKAYVICRDGKWEGLGYSDEDGCIQQETEYCLQEIPPGNNARHLLHYQCFR